MNYLIMLIYLLLILSVVLSILSWRNAGKNYKFLNNNYHKMFDDFDKTFPKFKRLPHQVFLMDLIGIGWLSLGWLLVAIFSLFPGRISSLVIEAILYTCTALAILLIAIALAIRLHFKQMSPGLNIPEQLPKPGVNKMFGLSRLLLIIAAILMPFWMLSTLVVV